MPVNKFVLIKIAMWSLAVILLAMPVGTFYYVINYIQDANRAITLSANTFPAGWLALIISTSSAAIGLISWNICASVYRMRIKDAIDNHEREITNGKLDYLETEVKIKDKEIRNLKTKVSVCKDRTDNVLFLASKWLSSDCMEKLKKAATDPLTGGPL